MFLSDVPWRDVFLAGTADILSAFVPAGRQRSQKESMDRIEHLGEERRLIFENFANGVDIETLRGVFKRSALEIEAEILFVAKKIKEYRFRRVVDASPHGAAPVTCDTLIDVRLNRMALLDTLRKLGDLYLSSELLLPKVTVQKLDHPAMIVEARHRMRT